MCELVKYFEIHKERAANYSKGNSQLLQDWEYLELSFSKQQLGSSEKIQTWFL